MPSTAPLRSGAIAIVTIAWWMSNGIWNPAELRTKLMSPFGLITIVCWLT